MTQTQESFSFKSALKQFSFLTYLCLGLVGVLSLSSETLASPLHKKNLPLGEKRIKLGKNDFDIKVENLASTKFALKVKFLNNSFEWKRLENTLLIPVAKIIIVFKEDMASYSLVYAQRTYSLQKNKQAIYTQIPISLYSQELVKIYKGNKHIGNIRITIRDSLLSDDAHKSNPKRSHLIDYSCSRYKIDFNGLDHQFLTAGCKIERVGKFGTEKGILKVSWLSPNWRSLHGTSEITTSTFLSSGKTRIKMINSKGEIKVIVLNVKFSNRLNRINTAFGVGPYSFKTSYNKEKQSNNNNSKETIAPSIMLYFNYKIDNENSLRGFNAFVFDESRFNNLGLYYANDIAMALDKKLTVTTLIGVQHLYFSFDQNSEVINGPIFPQGLEITYRHAFGIKNYLLGAGAFLSPTENVDYQNIWIRWGKTYFWEINYIAWKENNFSANMWGISVGVPLFGLF